MLSQMFRAAYGRGGAHTGEVRLALEAAEIPSFWRTIHEAQGELRRCRRYEHPLSVLVVGVENTGLRQVVRSEGEGADPEAWFLRRFECAALLVLGWILRDATREIDSVSYAAESHTYVIVLPETDAHGARAAAHRLSDLFEKRSSVGLSVGVAAFPSDGLTVEDLFHHASAALERMIAGTNAPNDRPPANAAALDRRRRVDASALNGRESEPAALNGRGSRPAALSRHESQEAALNGHGSAEPAASAGPATSLTSPTIGTTPAPTVGTSSSNTPAPGAAPPDGTEGATPARNASDMPVITPPHESGKTRVMRRASNG